MLAILLVDDEPMILEYSSHVLADLGGFHVLQADSGCQAIVVAERYTARIELLISEISMPGGMNGIDMATQLLVSRPEMKVLLVSGQFHEDLDFGPSWQFLAKPFRPSELVAKVQATLSAASSSADAAEPGADDVCKPWLARPMPLARPFASQIPRNQQEKGSLLSQRKRQ
jgi:DNA-binding response OmpR family regulator